MKKSLIFVSIAAATLFVSASVYAAVITQDGTTHLVTVDGTNVPGGNDIEFSPSTNVIFGGASSETSFLMRHIIQELIRKRQENNLRWQQIVPSILERY